MNKMPSQKGSLSWCSLFYAKSLVLFPSLGKMPSAHARPRQRKGPWSPPFRMPKAAKLMCSHTCLSLLPSERQILSGPGVQGILWTWAPTRGQLGSVYSLTPVPSSPFLPLPLFLHRATASVIVSWQFTVCHLQDLSSHFTYNPTAIEF